MIPCPPSFYWSAFWFAVCFGFGLSVPLATVGLIALGLKQAWISWTRPKSRRRLNSGQRADLSSGIQSTPQPSVVGSTAGGQDYWPTQVMPPVTEETRAE